MEAGLSQTITFQDKTGTVAMQEDVITGEIPSGIVNGSNVIFSLANIPLSGTVCVFLNGLLQQGSADYTISGNTITFTAPPGNTGFTDVITVNYLK